MNMNCPCQSNKPFSQCCQPLLTGTETAETPLQLMRSRYSAFTQGAVDYIERTMGPPASLNFNGKETLAWSQKVTWLGLEIVNAPAVQPGANIGYVEFIARFSENNKPANIHENSEFHLIDGEWYYIAGERKSQAKSSKPGRNDPCLCGSGKKYKRCCSRD